MDLQQLGAVGVLQDHRLADPQGLAIDLEDPLPLVVLDPVVVAEGHQFLAHPVMPGAVVVLGFLAPPSQHGPSSLSRRPWTATPASRDGAVGTSSRGGEPGAA